jgi:hypothetical protein
MFHRSDCSPIDRARLYHSLIDGQFVIAGGRRSIFSNAESVLEAEAEGELSISVAESRGFVDRLVSQRVFIKSE